MIIEAAAVWFCFSMGVCIDPESIEVEKTKLHVVTKIEGEQATKVLEIDCARKIIQTYEGKELLSGSFGPNSVAGWLCSTYVDKEV